MHGGNIHYTVQYVQLYSVHIQGTHKVRIVNENSYALDGMITYFLHMTNLT